MKLAHGGKASIRERINIAREKTIKESRGARAFLAHGGRKTKELRKRAEGMFGLDWITKGIAHQRRRQRDQQKKTTEHRDPKPGNRQSHKGAAGLFMAHGVGGVRRRCSGGQWAK